jgi:RNA polymerase sigma-70 factor (ECF subfamily)
LTTDELISGLQKGKRKALIYLYDAYGKLFYTIAMRYSKNPQEAEDLTQEAFLKIFQKIDQFSHQGSFEGWMKRIVINTCLNGIRGKQIIHQPLHNDDGETMIEPIDDTSILDDLAVDDIYKCIEELPYGYRMVFNLVVMDGYSHKEVADELGITESASRSQLTKAKQKLQALLLSMNSFYYERTGS